MTTELIRIKMHDLKISPKSNENGTSMENSIVGLVQHDVSLRISFSNLLNKKSYLFPESRH